MSGFRQGAMMQSWSGSDGAHTAEVQADGEMEF
jgi:hypothetical protein